MSELTKTEWESVQKRVCPNCGGKLLQFMVGFDIDTLQCVNNDSVQEEPVFNDPSRKWRWVHRPFPKAGEKRFHCFGYDL